MSALEKWKNDFKGFISELSMPMDDYKGIMEYIDEVPNETRWIPVSEKLPEIKEYHVSQPCIVYCSNGAYAFAECEENFFGQVGWNCERDDEYHTPVGEVVAWMPLPEPYEGERV